MPKVSAQLLREAFIAPIRFALLIDDQFPVYSKIKDYGAASNLDFDRATGLFQFCRDRGWLCDVDNAAHKDEELARVDHLHQSDLLVLDFHLDPAKKDDPTTALQILQRLAKSDHFNLVTIYTAASPVQVVRDVAFSLGAGVYTLAANAATRALEDLDPDVSDALSAALNDDVVDNFLSGKLPNGSANELRAILRAAGLGDGRLQNDIINTLCGQFMAARVRREIVSIRPIESNVRGSYSSEVNGTHWITQGNLFAVVVDKLEEPTVFVERLTNALVAWDPPVLQVMMVHARASLEKTGHLFDDAVLDTPRRQAGWLLRILLGKTVDERRNFLGDLYARLFSRLIQNVSNSIASFGSRIIEPVGATGHVERAKEMASGGADLNDAAVFHAMNEHLCSDHFVEGPMTTGVVFRAHLNGRMDYWVCTSPACDLVPGQNQKGWDGDLHPLRPISAARLNLVKDIGSIGGLLKTATRSRHIFLSADNVPIALEVLDENSRQMRLEALLLATEGVVSKARFNGFVLRQADQAPVATPVEFEVIGVLRSDYANRFLADAGQQRARIGLEFVDLPEAPSPQEIRAA
ncbi:MAG: response regulator receiver domain [Pseudomonadota bacterium]